ncbi:hypothetical protein EVA_06479 [gut metagenome]|uniref:Uncharacterized protein n=1 Tax=gut metagenome TaxID=749906 RepID=J9CYR7_9ZZZZ
MPSPLCKATTSSSLMQPNEPETQLNLEMFFSAVTLGKIQNVKS